MVVGYCIASFIAGALCALVVGLVVADRKREWIIRNARERLL